MKIKKHEEIQADGMEATKKAFSIMNHEDEESYRMFCRACTAMYVQGYLSGCNDTGNHIETILDEASAIQK